MHTLWIILVQITLLWDIRIFLNNGFIGGSELSNCEIRENFTSPYIVASYRSLVPVTGCEANVTTSGQNKQVHVVTVDPSVSDAGTRKGSHSVQLSIYSRVGRNLTGLSPNDVFVEDSRPMLFILSSPVPVTWKVALHGIDYDGPEPHEFIISTDSRIRCKRKKRLKCGDRKMALPTGSFAAEMVKDTNKSRLLYWTEQTFGAVSSFSSVKGRAVQFYTGRDSSAGPTCEDIPLQTSQRAFIHSEVPVPLIGCHSEDIGKSYIVRSFIIELLDRPPPSPGIDGLDVDIEPYEVPVQHNMFHGMGRKLNGPLLREIALHSRGRRKEVDFDLVIKTPENVKWKLHSRSISRQIGIVSNSQDVKTNEIKISEIGFREELIQSSGQDLIQWTNTFVSTTWLYVGVRGANTFRLLVPPKDHKMSRGLKPVGKPAGGTVAGTWTGGGQPVHHGEGVRGVSHEVTPRSGAWPGVGDTDQSAWSGGVLASGQVNSEMTGSSVVSARCYNTTMEVKLLKSFIETHKLDKSQMFVGKPECGMTTETATSVIFKVPLSQCGISAREILASNMRVHKSVLIIKTPPGLGSQLLTEEVGSGLMEDHGRDTDPETDNEDDIDERGSGLQDPDFGGMSDDEDFGAPDDLQDRWRDNITFNVECDEYINSAALSATSLKGFKRPPKGTFTKTRTSDQYKPHVSMLVSDNGWLDKAISAVPVEISPTRPVFVKAKMKNKDATLLADTCWFSNSENPFNTTALPTFFVKQGCSFGVRGLEWMDDPLMTGAKNTNFRTSHFRVESLLLEQLLPLESAVNQYGTPQQWFIHCEYRDCQRTDRSQAVQCPLLPEDRCRLYESRSMLIFPTFYWGPLTLGPFIVNTNRPRGAAGSRPSSKNQWFLNGRRSFNKGKGIGGGSTSSAGGVVVGVGSGAGGAKATIPNDPHGGQQAAPPQQLIIMEGLDPFLAVGIAFATFVLGIVLVAAIWCIHTRTGPVKTRATGHVSVEGSGDLTPNSSSPMTA